MRLTMKVALTWLLVTTAAAAQAQVPPTPSGTPRRAVLVTGASTGNGRKITERLAADGHFVYAGARKPQDLEALGRIPNVQAIRIDVTSASDIAEAVATITKAEAFTDTLALQMAPHGVSVSVIEPGNYDSEIFRTALARSGGDVKAGDRSQYKPPDDVAASVAQALVEPVPKRRYMTASNAREGEITIRRPSRKSCS